MDFTDEKTAWRVMQGAEASGRQASAQVRLDRLSGAVVRIRSNFN